MNKCRCSSWLVYKAYYEQLELDVKKLQYPWPRTIGIDEHSFVRNSKFHYKKCSDGYVRFIQKVCKGTISKCYHHF